jgi:hypothetical protein
MLTHINFYCLLKSELDAAVILRLIPPKMRDDKPLARLKSFHSVTSSKSE